MAWPVRITRYQHHPMTKQAGVIVTYRLTTRPARWQLIRSAFGASLDAPEIVRFEQWARERYPQAQIREK